MSRSEEGTSGLSRIPELFYDAIAYFIPALLLCTAQVLLYPAIGIPLVAGFLGLESTTDKLAALSVVLSVVLVIGQFLTSLSYDVIHRQIYRRLASMRGDKTMAERDRGWTREYVLVRHLDANLGMEITKRYARLVCSRNVAMGAILIAIQAAAMMKVEWAVWGTAVAVFAAYDSSQRRRYFYHYLRDAVVVIHEQQARETA